MYFGRVFLGEKAHFFTAKKVVCGQMAGNDSSEHINDLIGSSETG